jgi:hypothetical protein
MNRDSMTASAFPEYLASLHHQEEQLRQRALAVIAGDHRLALHLIVVEQAMDLADLLRQFETDDEDLKVIQMLGMRAFNAFGASLKLTLSGYTQNSALIMRDILETIFLLDLFKGDRASIERWRVADKKERMKQFSSVRVREKLDTRDGFTTKKRFEIYELFSELAGHPNMKSVFMMRSQKEGDAVIGPFIETRTLEAVLSEMGRLAVQVGEILTPFFPATHGQDVRRSFAAAKLKWLSVFYPKPKAEGT